ncbi:hypothetical protein [Halovivax gelatinilyticus]|nr:hypothetical protein [Halovivax gelatinilyticus]
MRLAVTPCQFSSFDLSTQSVHRHPDDNRHATVASGSVFWTI